ncbi:hypothetical protein [Paraliomyxa miuraensis]|uniref:hypothetical protein n=1 Tax=Paraliomyxa miuraensis TaxID=376150 RepID=UPI002257BF03|nr:hypothetical protein [Paraliomyxa miuraensis]MCX4240145.1 hypothetical protein [Paraliomyxa miuraensis]
MCDDANTCVPCTEHEQCGEAACNLFTGGCLPADAVVHVGGAMPDFATIAAAVASFDMMMEGTIIVHAGSYNEALTVNGGRVLAFLVNDGDLPEWDTPAGNPATPQLTVMDATVLIDGLQLSGNGSAMAPGMRVDAGQAWVDRSRIVGNDGGGIVAQNAGELVLRNCFVGGDRSDVAALRVDGADATILYTTLGAGYGTATALSCGGAFNVQARNSIFVARTDGSEIPCVGATIDHCAAEMALGGTNASVGPLDIMWFTGYAAGDFDLSASGTTTFADIGQWQTGDPTIDIDGDLRPTTDGASDFAGADVP